MQTKTNPPHTHTTVRETAAQRCTAVVCTTQPPGAGPVSATLARRQWDHISTRGYGAAGEPQATEYNAQQVRGVVGGDRRCQVLSLTILCLKTTMR